MILHGLPGLSSRGSRGVRLHYITPGQAVEQQHGQQRSRRHQPQWESRQLHLQRADGGLGLQQRPEHGEYAGEFRLVLGCGAVYKLADDG